MPHRKQQGLEHRQRRPGRLALGGRIERIKKHRDRAPIDQRNKRLERSRRSLEPSKSKPLLTDRTLRHPLLSSSESP
jgi:hypothetical protein